MGMGRRSRAVVATVAMMTALMATGVGAASAAETDAQAVAACQSAVESAVGSRTLTATQQGFVDTANEACEGLTAATASSQQSAVLTTLNRALSSAARSTSTSGSSGSGNSDSTSSTDTTSSDATSSTSGTTTGTTTGDLNCDDFATQAEAQAVLAADPSDPNNLDADNDGQACESLPSGSSSGATATDTSYPSGGVASGDGSTGAVDLGGLVLLAMLGLTVLAGATRVAVDRGARKAA